MRGSLARVQRGIIHYGNAVEGQPLQPNRKENRRADRLRTRAKVTNRQARASYVVLL